MVVLRGDEHGCAPAGVLKREDPADEFRTRADGAGADEAGGGTGVKGGSRKGKWRVGGVEGFGFDSAGDEVWRFRGEELGDEKVGRIGVEIWSGVDLLEAAGVDDADVVGNCGGFVLIVGDVEGCDTEFLLDGADGIAELEAAGGIEISERFVEEE